MTSGTPSEVRVAVVIPCYDDGATLGDAIASLEDQEPHELVVVDDGSRDAATLSRLDELAAGGIRVVRQENAGLGPARMAGVRATAARYVLPLDADDALAGGAVAALADALDANPSAVVAWGDTEIWGDIELPLRVGRTLDPWLITHLNTLPVASMVRRDALDAAGGWQLRRGYEDWDLWMAFAERGWTGVYVPHPVHRYRRHGGRMLADCIDRHDELYGELRARHPRLFASRRSNWLRARVPVRDKLLFPLIGSLPFASEFDRLRLYLLADQPRQVLTMRRLRSQAERTT